MTLEVNPHISNSMILNKNPKNKHWWQNCLYTKRPYPTGMSYVLLVAVNLKFTKALNIRPETSKFPEENMKHFSISELVRVFFLKTYPQIMAIKGKSRQTISHQPHNLLHNKGQNQSSKEKFFSLIKKNGRKYVQIELLTRD